MVSGSERPPLVALLLSGGGGTRLWPLSTEQTPKQFLRVFDGQSLFQKTVLRATEAGVDCVHVLANQSQADQLDQEWQGLYPPHGEGRHDDAGANPLQCLLEPLRRDSGPAIAAGVAQCLSLYGPHCVVMVLPCDHLIPDHAAFAEAVAQAVVAARAGYLVTFGVKPRAPVTDYGYIHAGAALADLPAHAVRAFVEKPDRPTAEAYLRNGHYLWNSGMFLFEAGVFARQAALHMPALWQGVQTAFDKGQQTPQGYVLNAEAFAAVKPISIDYALFEKSQQVAVVPVAFDWSDVGGWAAMHEALPQQASGLALLGPVYVQDSQNSLVLSDGIPVLALGLSDMVVVATQSGVFVAPKDRTSEIKALLAQLPKD